MACADPDFLWKEHFKDPSQVWDSERGPRSPDFRHTQTMQPLWMDGLHNPPWVQEKLRRRSGVKEGEFCTISKEQQDYPTLLDLIKACGRQKDLRQGRRIHAGILKTGLLEKDIRIGTSLLRMYAKCGDLAKAQELFDELPTWDVVSWTSLITGYAQYGLGEEALDCFRRMQDEGFFPNMVTFVSILKACGSIGAIEKGEEIHAEVSKLGLLKKHDVVLGTSLVDMYAKCGVLAKAQEVFDKLRTKNVVSWNALISGYAQHELGEEALYYFKRMQDEGFSPDTVTFVCTLKACGSIGAIAKGEEIHSEVCRLGLLENNDTVLGTALMDMYAKCGALAKAQDVFDELFARDVVTWNVLIAGYAQHGLGEEALNCFMRMQDEGFSPNTATFICILKVCGSLGATKKGKELHAKVQSLGLLENHDIVLGTALVDMYAKCGMLAKAQEVFYKLPTHGVVSWNALIAGYAQHGLGEEVLNWFEHMRDEGFAPDAVTFACILKACGSIGASEKGEEIHAEVCRLGLLENHDVVLGTALVDMYAKCGAIAKAREVFDELSARNVICWNALITGYAQHGLMEEALNCFGRMQDEGFSPNTATFVCILKACGSIKKGKEIHDEVRRLGLLEDDDIVLGIALVDMYAKCGDLAKAQEVFDELPTWNVVSWNVLIGGYARHGLGDEALNCFQRMRDEGFSPDTATFVCNLKACGRIGAIGKGEEMHAEVHRLGLSKNHDIILGNALVDMYAKCGVVAKAQEVFDKLAARDVVSWTALIAGYAGLGNAMNVFNLFRRMIGEHIEPDSVTFIVLLTSCSHAGLVEEGQMYFDTMSTVYCISPTLEHHTCMVDLFSRAGQFDRAISIIEKVPVSDLWLALLGACQKWVNMELGRWAFKHVVWLDSYCATAYVCMSNIYAATVMQ